MNLKEVEFIIESDRFTKKDLDNFNKIYKNIASYYSRFEKSVKIKFNWNNNDLVEGNNDFYQLSLRKQQEIFKGAGFWSDKIINSWQVYLESLSPKIIELNSNFFDEFNLIFDSFSCSNKNLSMILARIDYLKANKIKYNCLTILNQDNLTGLKSIYKFYQKLNLPFKLLTVFSQPEVNKPITASDFLQALYTLSSLVLENPTSIEVEPINTYIEQIIHYYTSDSYPSFYQKREGNSVYHINVDGNLFNYANFYRHNFYYGNLLTTPLKDILCGFNYQQAVNATEKRTDDICKSCKFFGSCDGYPIAEAIPLNIQLDKTGNPECFIVKNVLGYLEEKLLVKQNKNNLNLVYINNLQNKKQLNLQKGVQINFNPLDCKTLSERIMFSSGTTNNIKPVLETLRYHPAAIIPQEPWRKPTLAEYNLLCNFSLFSDDNKTNPNSCIKILHLPEALITPLQTIIQERDESQLNHQACLNHPDWHNAIAKILAHLTPNNFNSSLPPIVTLYTAISGLKTITKLNRGNPLTETYVGMHIDSWEAPPLTKDYNSKKRLCINLGQEDRFFLFINLTVVELLKAIGLPEVSELKNRGLFLGYKFMKLYPSYPVVKVKIAPGEAYIAPTTNIIHDATSVGKKHLDVALHCLGYFH